MAGWNDLPKELKWIIFKYIIKDCINSVYDGKIDHFCRWKNHGYNNSRIISKALVMSELITLLSQIDKQSRLILISKTVIDSSNKKYFSLIF